MNDEVNQGEGHSRRTGPRYDVCVRVCFMGRTSIPAALSPSRTHMRLSMVGGRSRLSSPRGQRSNEIMEESSPIFRASTPAAIATTSLGSIWKFWTPAAYRPPPPRPAPPRSAAAAVGPLPPVSSQRSQDAHLLSRVVMTAAAGGVDGGGHHPGERKRSPRLGLFRTRPWRPLGTAPVGATVMACTGSTHTRAAGYRSLQPQYHEEANTFRSRTRLFLPHRPLRVAQGRAPDARRPGTTHTTGSLSCEASRGCSDRPIEWHSSTAAQQQRV